MSIKHVVNLGGYQLTDFPGSESDITISHGAYVHEDLRGKGFGKKLHRERIFKARADGKAYMLAVVNEDNAIQINIMNKFGWTKLETFVSECTCHRLALWGRSPYLNKGLEN
ncbi:MAG TPA: GNAT family N-acetyltransferase [Candidatus Dojkabacteria bacterium]|nr:GNAT family N-acetyltransferase [Candidatus Dojkabacteria bacterium]